MGEQRNYKRFETGSFVFPARIGRMEYFLRNLGLGLVMIPFELIMTNSSNGALSFISFILFTTLFVFGLWFSVFPRLRDVNWNSKLAWLVLIPGVNIIFAISLFATPGK